MQGPFRYRPRGADVPSLSVFRVPREVGPVGGGPDLPSVIPDRFVGRDDHAHGVDEVMSTLPATPSSFMTLFASAVMVLAGTRSNCSMTIRSPSSDHTPAMRPSWSTTGEIHPAVRLTLERY